MVKVIYGSLCLQTTGFQWYNDVGEFADQGFGPTLLQGFNETACLVPDKDSDVGDSSGAANNHNEGQSNHSSHTETFQVPPPIVAPRELNSRERETAISRYKEKKKTRRYICMHSCSFFTVISS